MSWNHRQPRAAPSKPAIKLAGLRGGGHRARSPGRAALSVARRQIREPYILLLLAPVSVAATAAVVNVLMARALEPSGRGWVALLLAVAYFISELLLLGSERSFIAGYAGSPAPVAVRSYTLLILAPCVAALASIAVVVAVAPPGIRPVATVLALAAAFAVVNALLLALRAVAIVSGRYADFLRWTVLTQVVLLATLTVLYLTDVARPAIWYAAYVLAFGLPALTCWILWARPDGGGASSAPGARERRRAVRIEGLTLLPATLAHLGVLRAGHVVLPALASTAALGFYVVVATITELLGWPLQAYADSRLGTWREAHRQGRLRPGPILLCAVAYAVVAAPLLGGVTTLLVVPIFGEEYAASRALVAPLVVAAALYAVSRVCMALLIAQSRTLLASGAEVCGFAAGLITFLLLIPSKGALGAAYGSMIGCGTCLVLAATAVLGEKRPLSGRRESRA